MPKQATYSCLCGKELTREEEDKVMADFDDFVQFLKKRYGTNITSKEMLIAVEGYKRSGHQAASL